MLEVKEAELPCKLPNRVAIAFGNLVSRDKRAGRLYSEQIRQAKRQAVGQAVKQYGGEAVEGALVAALANSEIDWLAYALKHLTGSYQKQLGSLGRGDNLAIFEHGKVPSLYASAEELAAMRVATRKKRVRIKQGQRTLARQRNATEGSTIRHDQAANE